MPCCVAFKYVCAGAEEMLFAVQSNCSWRGASAENYAAAAAFNASLRPGPGGHASLLRWAWAVWGVDAGLLAACGWTWGAVFAVSAARLRAHPLRTYEAVLDQLAVAGTNGGLAGHYLERSWRAAFGC